MMEPHYKTHRGAFLVHSMCFLCVFLKVHAALKKRTSGNAGYVFPRESLAAFPVRFQNTRMQPVETQPYCKQMMLSRAFRKTQ